MKRTIALGWSCGILFASIFLLSGWSLPGIGSGKDPKGTEEVSKTVADDAYGKFVKGLKITRDLLDRFIQVYPEYAKVVSSCSRKGGRDVSGGIGQVTKDCVTKIGKVLAKYKFDYQTFPSVLARITTAYAIASMEGSPLSGMMVGKRMQRSLVDAGQKEITKEEISLVKKYLPKLDALFNQN